jgi:ring-1,2-phenylacetyl-CoA epoxidase subunit PaaC
MTAVASLALAMTPELQYVLRLGDSCLVHAQRLAEWCGHAPILEEDIALTNLSLDLVGQARALLTHVGAAYAVDGPFDEDQLAFLRDERDFRNLTLVELPGRRGGRDFADQVLRNLFLGAWLREAWGQLASSTDAELAAIAAKSLKESRYHVAHAAEWVVRLGDGTDESTRRMRTALDALWPYTAEMFVDDAADEAAAAQGLGPRRSALRAGWLATIEPVLADAGLPRPADGKFLSTGTDGVHSEHLGYLLAEMQSLQRSFPGGKW